MNKQEYINRIKEIFDECFQDEIMCTESDKRFLPAGITDSLFEERASKFASKIRELGLSFSNCYHANGIGNNNEYKIYLKSTDEDGFEIEKNVCIYEYVYGLYNDLVVARLSDTDRHLIKKAGRL